jgi:hypothetical protein
MGLPLDLEFRTKGQLAIDVCSAAYADGLRFGHDGSINAPGSPATPSFPWSASGVRLP